MNIATIGSGVIVRRMIDAIRNTPGCEVTAVYSRTKERAEAFAGEYGIGKTYDSLEEMLQDPDIDTVYIASPNSLHHPQAKQVLAAGKNAIVEKPFTSTLDQAKELFALAEQNGVRVFEAITTRWLPNYAIIKENLEQAGPVAAVTGSFCQYSSKYQAYLDGLAPNVFTLEYDGGALNDINVYNLHFVTGLFGRPQGVLYLCRKGRTGIDTGGTLLLEYPDFTATLVGAKDCSSEPEVRIMGTKGTISTQGSPGVIGQVSFQSPKGDMIGKENKDLRQWIGIRQHPNHMDYEVEGFLNMDAQRYQQEKESTLLVMEILEEAKRQRDQAESPFVRM